MKFRELTRQEQTLVNRAFDRWGVFDALKEQTLLVHAAGSINMVCLVSPELASALVRMDSTIEESEPGAAGLAIGELGKKQFTPTLAGANLFARASGMEKKRRYYVKVGQNAEKLVLYGRDVMGDSIIDASPELGENELVVLVNAGGEGIGIGRTRFSGRAILQKGRVTITTVADAGSYLRDEDEAKEGHAKLMTAKAVRGKDDDDASVRQKKGPAI